MLCLRVISSSSTDGLDLPELTSIQMGSDGYSAFAFKDDGSSTLIMRSDELNEN